MSILVRQLIQISLRSSILSSISINRNNFNPIYPKSTTKIISPRFILDHLSPKSTIQRTQRFERSVKSPPPQIPIEFRGQCQYLSTIIESNDGMRPGNGVRRWQAGFATPCSVSVDAGVVSAPLVPTM